MVRVYVRERGEFSGSLPPTRTEVKLEATDGVSVDALLDAVARLKNTDKQELRQYTQLATAYYETSLRYSTERLPFSIL